MTPERKAIFIQFIVDLLAILSTLISKFALTKVFWRK